MPGPKRQEQAGSPDGDRFAGTPRAATPVPRHPRTGPAGSHFCAFDHSFALARLTVLVDAQGTRRDVAPRRFGAEGPLSEVLQPCFLRFGRGFVGAGDEEFVSQGHGGSPDRAGSPPPAAPGAGDGWCSGSREVGRGFLAIAADFDFVGHALIALQRLHSSGLNRGDVNEAVLAAVFGSNEAVAFVGVEEFDCADRHAVFPFKKPWLPGRTMRTGRASCRLSKGSRRRFAPGPEGPKRSSFAEVRRKFRRQRGLYNIDGRNYLIVPDCWPPGSRALPNQM